VLPDARTKRVTRVLISSAQAGGCAKDLAKGVRGKSSPGFYRIEGGVLKRGTRGGGGGWKGFKSSKREKKTA